VVIKLVTKKSTLLKTAERFRQEIIKNDHDDRQILTFCLSYIIESLKDLKCFECGRTTVIGYKLGIMVFCKACYINNVRAIRRRD